MRPFPVLVAALLAVACSSGTATDSTQPATASQPAADTLPAAPSTTTSAITDTTTALPDAAVVLPERIVALSEEFLLADLLALGVRPVASTANDPSGFVGIDPADTAGIEPIFSPDFNLEAMAVLRPELIVVYQSYIDIGVVSLGDLEAIAETVVIDETADWRQQFVDTAAALGLDATATSVLQDVDAAFDAAAATLGGVEISAVSVSPGPLIRAYTDDRTQLTDVLLDAGAALVPGAGSSGADDNGRLTLSLEQVSLLSADVLLLLQSSIVPGESDALADVETSPLWSTLPAVQSGTVITLDRLSYPGAEGAVRFVTDVAAALP
jgi:ABC-type Fe3+-hydroxamate transport system substrate-binding protein